MPLFKQRNWHWWQVAIGLGSTLALMLASLAGRDAVNDFERVKRIEQALLVMQLAGQAVHEFQVERGLSVGAALGADFAVHALPTQRREVDRAIIRLQVRIDDADPALHSLLVTAGSAAKKAQAQRHVIDRNSRSAPLEELMLPWNQAVSAWLRVGDDLLRQLQPSDDQYALAALWALIESKEKGGRERALILAALLHNELDEATIDTLQRSFGAQRSLLQQAMLAMPEAAAQALNRIVEDAEPDQVEQVRTAVLRKENPTLAPEQWYALVSNRQDALQKVADEFVDQIAARVADSRRQTWRNIWLAGALLFLAFGGVLLGWLGTRFHHGAQRYRALVQGLNGVVWEANPKTWRYTFVSRQAAALSGTPTDTWLAEGAMLDWLHVVDRERVLQAFVHCVESCEPASLEYRLKPPGCASRWVRNDCTAELHIGQGVVLRGVLTDLSETRQAQAQVDFVERILANTSEAVTVTDAERCILRVNRAFTQITGYAESEVIGQNPRILASGRHGAEFYAEMWNSINSIGFWSGEIWNRRKNGEEYPELLSISCIRNEEGDVTHYVAVFSDIANHKRDQALIHQLAESDALTGLPNWARFQTCLHDAMKNHKPKGTLAVLLINLDRFRQINEGASQAVGDYVLQALAERIVHCTSGNLVARRAADEYGVLCRILPSLAAAGDLASTLLNEIAQPVLVLGHPYVLTASIGIAVVDNDPAAAALDSDGLLREADLALSHAKQNGANNCQFFSPEMSARVNECLQLEEGLNSALERGEIFLHYQPQIELLKGNIIGAEALMRWQHPTLGLIAPDRFIPLAENTGQIIALGEWALRTACTQAKRWHDAGFEGFRIAVNFSPRQFRRLDWPLLIARVLHETGFPATCLELEITEGALMHDPAMAKSVLTQVRGLGVAVAIDDFGTGYSSLSYLKDLPVNRLKIDRCFVDGCPDQASDVAIVDTIIDLAGKLGLEVVAEGVETFEHLNFLSTRVCQIGQGYLFSRPLSVEQMTAALLDGRFAGRQKSAG
jgi:diguanylate cyclase (GGDEF)-like protein/PAS domain S-box-containing protein